MVSYTVREKLPVDSLEDGFIAIPDNGIPVLDDRLEEDIHLELEAVQDEELFDGFVDEGLEDDEEDEEDDMAAGIGAGAGNGRRGPDLAWDVYREFETKAEFEASEIPAHLASTFSLRSGKYKNVETHYCKFLRNLAAERR